MLLKQALEVSSNLVECNEKNLDKVLCTIATIESLIETKKYSEANSLLKATTEIPKSKRPIVRALFDEDLKNLNLAWTNHGFRKTFNFWSDKEKAAYISNSLEIIGILKELSPYVCLGFGTALGLKREGRLILNDDDIDILIAFPEASGLNFSKALSLINDKLIQHSLQPHNHCQTHLTVKGCDIFVGFYDSGESISWYPSNFGNLTLNDLFPTSEIEAYDLKCPVPFDCSKYLEVTYGPEWIHPDPNFDHSWDFRPYKKFE